MAVLKSAWGDPGDIMNLTVANPGVALPRDRGATTGAE
jgi:hypothetical protein